MNTYNHPGSIHRIFLNAQPRTQAMMASAELYDLHHQDFRTRLLFQLIDTRTERPAKNWPQTHTYNH